MDKLKINQVCVYCASSTKIDPKYFDATRIIANQLVDHNIKVIYGGGSVGLMGTLADTILERDGAIKGIIPEFMKNVEWDHKGVSEMEIVNTMHERKNNFLINTDAIITLPGGCGTFEELLEAITLKRLGIIAIPIIIVNIDGYYDPLLEMLNKAISEQFMSILHNEIWTVITDPLEIVSTLKNSKTWLNGINQAKA